MKTFHLILACAFLSAGSIMAQETTVTTTTSSGTIAEYVPGTAFVVKETAGPVSYRYGKTVTYVTKSGRVITEPRLKTRVTVGRPVTVHYATEGDHRVINRVVLDDRDDDDDDDDDDGK